MQRLKLFGDSVIDNIQYVGKDERCVLEHLRNKDNTIGYDLHAIDGHTTFEVLEFQLSEPTGLPSVLSVGGNDLLRHLNVITDEDASLPFELLDKIHSICRGFQTRLSNILKRLEGPALICTVYNPDFLRDRHLADFQKSSEVVIGVANDIIQSATRQAGKDILDLRDVFTTSDDFANPIEPSHAGGQKFATAILDWRSTIAE